MYGLDSTYSTSGIGDTENNIYKVNLYFFENSLYSIPVSQT